MEQTKTILSFKNKREWNSLRASNIYNFSLGNILYSTAYVPNLDVLVSNRDVWFRALSRDKLQIPIPSVTLEIHCIFDPVSFFILFESLHHCWESNVDQLSVILAH